MREWIVVAAFAMIIISMLLVVVEVWRNSKK